MGREGGRETELSTCCLTPQMPRVVTAELSSGWKLGTGDYTCMSVTQTGARMLPLRVGINRKLDSANSEGFETALPDLGHRRYERKAKRPSHR